MINWLKRQLARLRGMPENLAENYGTDGEEEAARFLSSERGMKILFRNWRSPKDRRYEIDIICRSPEGVLVFVEVKSRATKDRERGYGSAVHNRKKSVLIRAANTYLHGLGPRRQEITYRYDVVVVERVNIEHSNNTRLDVHHFENVPLFSRG